MNVLNGVFNNTVFVNQPYQDTNNNESTVKVTLTVNDGTFTGPSSGVGYIFDNGPMANSEDCVLNINGGTYNARNLILFGSYYANNNLSGSIVYNSTNYIFDSSFGKTVISGGEYNTTNTSHNKAFQAYGDFYFLGGTINAPNATQISTSNVFVFGTDSNPSAEDPVMNLKNVSITNNDINWKSGVMKVKSYEDTNKIIPNNYYVKKQIVTGDGNDYYKLSLRTLTSRGDWESNGRDASDLAKYRKYIGGNSTVVQEYNNKSADKKADIDINGDNIIDLVDLISFRLIAAS